MKTETKILLGILIFSGLLLTGAVIFFSKGQVQNKLSEEAIHQIDYSTGQKIGTDSAKIKLVEFADFHCPACKALEPIIQQILKDYKNDIQLTYKYFPLPIHLNAKAAANFAILAAYEGKFWQIHDKLFETQDEWANLPNPKDYFLKMGASFNLDQIRLKQALDNNTYYPLMDQTTREGNNLGVDATPTIFLNGKKQPIQSFTDLKSAIEKELANVKSFDLVIKNKKLVSGSDTLKVIEGNQVTINITSDGDEELHLHGYDKSIDLEANKPAKLEFNANLTGRFPFELEKSKIELGALEVQPK